MVRARRKHEERKAENSGIVFFICLGLLKFTINKVVLTDRLQDSTEKSTEVSDVGV